MVMSLEELFAQTKIIKDELQESLVVEPDPRTIVEARQHTVDGFVVLVTFADGTTTQAGWSDKSPLALACKRDNVSVQKWNEDDYKEAEIANKVVQVKTTYDQEILAKAPPQEQESARNRIVLAISSGKNPKQEDLELLTWVEGKRSECEKEVIKLRNKS